MEVDEDYDDDGDEEKRPAQPKAEHESPKSANPISVAAGGD
jgi:hypothetical protein